MTQSPLSAAYAALLLRLSLGVMYLAHSVVLKWLTFTLTGTAQYFQSIGLSPTLAYLTFFAEAVGGVLLILGIQSRWVALALLPILVGALGVHSGNGWVFTATGGGWEYPLYLIILSVAQALLGDGAYAISPSRPLHLKRQLVQGGALPVQRELR
ncbi:putative oxidoreductase MhqP [Ensifer psoraleae]|uniref:DoxX family protein n=1 Tax=Sinorhizobium psoraleae TaxID=520838 RepID=UPI001568D592|nr:DoxX family protein [Sinorhizobium psoraleae]NRP75276.1 putative oxidoreductase MhqP [Sinorhizobium psoraleae]